jgi:hypothetical protein
MVYSARPEDHFAVTKCRREGIGWYINATAESPAATRPITIGPALFFWTEVEQHGITEVRRIPVTRRDNAIVLVVSPTMWLLFGYVIHDWRWPCGSFTQSMPKCMGELKRAQSQRVWTEGLLCNQRTSNDRARSVVRQKAKEIGG